MSDQAYVVMATQGPHYEQSIWAVAVYADEGAAQQHAEKAESWVREYEARAEKAARALRQDIAETWWLYGDEAGWEQSPYDPHLNCIFKDESPEYHVESVPLRTALPVVEGGGDA